MKAKAETGDFIVFTIDGLTVRGTAFKEDNGNIIAKFDDESFLNFDQETKKRLIDTLSCIKDVVLDLSSDAETENTTPIFFQVKPAT